MKKLYIVIDQKNIIVDITSDLLNMRAEGINALKNKGTYIILSTADDVYIGDTIDGLISKKDSPLRKISADNQKITDDARLSGIQKLKILGLTDIEIAVLTGEKIK